MHLLLLISTRQDIYYHNIASTIFGTQLAKKLIFIREPRENEHILSLGDTITGKPLVFIVAHRVMNPNWPEETLLSIIQG